MEKPPILTASVKVMRSYDYCHFEVVLEIGRTEASGLSLQTVDALRKEAARLADNAVEQSKIAKRQRQLNEDGPGVSYQISLIREKAETDRTPEEQATLKAHDDEVFAASRRYDYDDDWN